MNKETNAQVISTHDFAALGLDHLAYVRDITIDGRLFYAVHAADGRQVIVLPTRAQADSTIRQHELTPLWVH